MSRANIPGNKENCFKKSWKQICIYVFPKKLLEKFKNKKNKSPLEKLEDIEILRFLEMGFEVRMIEMSSKSIAVDVPDDIRKVLKRLNE